MTLWPTPDIKVPGSGPIHAYLEQYVKTATKGKVEVEWALHVSRMRLVCNECCMTLTCSEPTGTTVDYGVQEFVKLHAHTGGHKDTPTGYDVAAGGWVNAKAVTADFKPVAGGFGFVPLPPSANAVLSNIKAGSMIDESYAKAEQIKGQMAAYDKELAEKMTDESLAKKIAILQNADYSKELEKGIAELKEKGLLSGETQGIAQAAIIAQKEELQALQNVLTMKNLAKKKAQILGELSGVHNDPPPVVKKDKPLKIATGRKFK